MASAQRPSCRQAVVLLHGRLHRLSRPAVAMHRFRPPRGGQRDQGEGRRRQGRRRRIPPAPPPGVLRLADPPRPDRPAVEEPPQVVRQCQRRRHSAATARARSPCAPPSPGRAGSSGPAFSAAAVRRTSPGGPARPGRSCRTRADARAARRASGPASRRRSGHRNGPRIARVPCSGPCRRCRRCGSDRRCRTPWPARSRRPRPSPDHRAGGSTA